jgi:hypothetical protein
MFHQKMGTMLYNCGDLLTDEDRKMIRENVHVWGDGGYSGLKLDDEKGVNELRRGIEKVEPDIVFIEPFRSCGAAKRTPRPTWPSSWTTSWHGERLRLRFHPLSPRAQGRRRGGRSHVRRTRFYRAGGRCGLHGELPERQVGDFRELTWSKARYLQPPPPVRLEYDRDTGWYDYVSEDDIDRAILEVLEVQDDPINKAGICDILTRSRTKVEKALKRLVDANRMGAVTRMGYRYTKSRREEAPADSPETGYRSHPSALSLSSTPCATRFATSSS